MHRLLLLLAVSWFGTAQTAAPPLTFEVASVKTTAADQSPVTVRKNASGPVPTSANPIRFSRRRATLESLLLEAYSLTPHLLIGPEWLASERYEIEARAPEGATEQQQLVMLQNLLAERFLVNLHRETKQLPVYELVLAKGGAKLKPSQPGPNALPAFRQNGPLRVSAPRDGGAPMARFREHGTMQGLAARLSRYVDRPILDRTGLDGDYDVVMTWTLTTQPPPDAAAASDPGISIFAALESQLGLRLEPKKGMVEVIVVDHAEKVPTAN